MKENWFNEPRDRRVTKVSKEKMVAIVARIADSMNNGPEPQPVTDRVGVASNELWHWAFSAGGVSWVGEGLENALGSLEHLRRYGRQPVPEVRWAGRIPAPVAAYLEHHGISWREIDEPAS